MWISPKPTLGGAGMWDEVRSNGIIQLQHYKPDGTVLAGFFNTVRSIYSEAPNYRIIAVNQPYWEYANGHTQEPLDTLMDWLEKNPLQKLQQFNIGGYTNGDVDVKIRILTDFMKSFVPIYGVLHKLPLSDAEFNVVVKHMAEAPNLGNSQQQVAIYQKASSSSPSTPAPTPLAPSQFQPPSAMPPPSGVVSYPISSSQLVTRYEKDPITGQIRAVQVYQPVTVPTGTYPAGTVLYVSPNASNAYHSPVGQSVQYPGARLPSNMVVYHSKTGPAPSSSLAQPPPAMYVPPPPVSQSQAYPPPQPLRYTPPPGVAAPNQYIAPNNPYFAPQQQSAPLPPSTAPYPPPNTSSPAPNQNTAPLLPVSEWDAQKPGNPSSQPASPFLPPGPSAPSASPILPFSGPSKPLESPSPQLPPQVQQPPSGSSSPAPGPSAPPEDDEEDKNLCKLCFERDLDCALLPCSHVTCYQCATTLNLTKCPFCRTEISKIIKLYRA